MKSESNLALRKHTDGRLEGLRTDRYSWWLHWRELADYILPRRYKWLVTPNQYNRGLPINGMIIDSTGTIASRTLASGMMSGITSPTRPWFKLKLEGLEADEASPVVLWLAECERRMMRVFAESNFYNSIAQVYADLVVFGTATMIIYEDYDDVIRCYNPCAGEYYLGNSDRMFVDTFYREFVLTVSQAVQWFGEDGVSQSTLSLFRSGGASLASEVAVCHAIEPNTKQLGGIAKTFLYREVYWERGAPNDEVLRKTGFNEFPVICPRWDLVSNDAYGRSPAMDALGDIKQLQQETKRKAQAIDKMVNPPMIADVQLKNQPASLLPGGVTYVNGLRNDNPGFRPVYQVAPQIEHMMKDIMEIQERIRLIFFNDLFLMISQLETVRTATEIDARREEKLILLGPVLERFENEGLDPVVDRVFAIMNRARLLPPPPQEVQGMPIQVEYSSMLAQAQKAATTASIERLLATVGNMAALQPAVMDKLNLDQTVDSYAMALSVDPKVINDDDAVTAIRNNRMQQEQAQQQMQVTDAGVNAAKTLSETDVGGGINALQLATGGASPQGAPI